MQLDAGRGALVGPSLAALFDIGPELGAGRTAVVNLAVRKAGGKAWGRSALKRFSVADLAEHEEDAEMPMRFDPETGLPLTERAQFARQRASVESVDPVLTQYKKLKILFL